MTTTEMVKVYINQLCAEIGVDPKVVYNAQSQAWYFTRGSSVLEVYMKSYETARKTIRTFVRVFSPIYTLPHDPQKQLDVAKAALEANSQFMGVKLASIASKGHLYAVAERDIEGMDYNEFITLVNDLGFWADKLDDHLKERFGAPNTSAN